MRASRSSAGNARRPLITRRSLVKYRFDLIGIDAGQSDEDEYLPLGLQHVDRRLPARLARSGQRLQIQKLLVQALRAGERLDGIGKHPVDGVLRRHLRSSVTTIGHEVLRCS